MLVILAWLGNIARYGAAIWKGGRALWAWVTGTKFGKMLAWTMAGSVGLYIQKAATVIGFSLVAYEFGLPVLREYVMVPLLGVPPDWVAFLALTKIDHATTVVLSAIVVQMASKIKIQRDRQAWQTPL